MSAPFSAIIIVGALVLPEVILNQELGEPFRRDAMKAPVEVAGIDSKDTVVQ